MSWVMGERPGPHLENADTLEALAIAVESVANRAADVIHATARAVGATASSCTTTRTSRQRWPPRSSTSRPSWKPLAIGR